jgi:hypothetical protein
MKDNFTEQQREIVARKMGFEGPMQNFSEFLMSSPATASRYGAVVTKLGEKAPGFAVGGAVKKASATAIIKAYSDKYGANTKKLLAFLMTLLQSGNALLLQEKNTVFFIDKHMPRVVALLMATTDSGPELNAALEVLINKVRSSGITMVYGIKNNPELKQALLSRNFKVIASDVPEYAWRAMLS